MKIKHSIFGIMAFGFIMVVAIAVSLSGFANRATKETDRPTKTKVIDDGGKTFAPVPSASIPTISREAFDPQKCIFSMSERAKWHGWKSTVKPDGIGGTNAVYIAANSDFDVEGAFDLAEKTCREMRTTLKDMENHHELNLASIIPSFGFVFRDGVFGAFIKDPNQPPLDFNSNNAMLVDFDFFDKNGNKKHQVFTGFLSGDGNIGFANEDALAILDLIMTNKRMEIKASLIEGHSVDYSFELATFKANDLINAKNTIPLQ